MSEKDLTDMQALAHLQRYREFTVQHWGEKCSEFDPACFCCKAWKRYADEYNAVTYVMEEPQCAKLLAP